jgi:hypothetical protein
MRKTCHQTAAITNVRKAIAAQIERISIFNVVDIFGS